VQKIAVFTYRSPHFCFPRDAPAIITQYVAWMKRQFNACQSPRSMFNSFRVIRCLSQCVSPKIAIFTTFLFPLGTPLGQSRYMLYGWKENSMLTNCLAECAHLTITVSEIQRDIGRKSSFFITPCIRRPRYGGFRRNSATPFCMEKTRMAWLPDGEKISKISLVFLAQLTNVTDGRTDRRKPHAGNSRAMHSIARQK